MRQIERGDGRHVRDGVAFDRLDLIVAEIQQLDITDGRTANCTTEPLGRQTRQPVVAQVDRLHESFH